MQSHYITTKKTKRSFANKYKTLAVFSRQKVINVIIKQVLLAMSSYLKQSP